MSDVTDRFVELLEQADQPGAVELVAGLAQQGAPPGGPLEPDPSTAATSSALDTLFAVVQDRFPAAWGLVEESGLVEIKPAGSPHLNRP